MRRATPLLGWALLIACGRTPPPTRTAPAMTVDSAPTTSVVPNGDPTPPTRSPATPGTPPDSAGVPIPPTEVYIARADPRDRPFTSRVISYMSMWDAVASLDDRFANIMAHSAEEKRFAKALTLQLNGDLREAANEFNDLAHHAVDSIVRRRAIVATVSSLQELDDWAGLARAAHDSAVQPVFANADRAGVLAWADAFSGAPPQGFRIPRNGVRAAIIPNVLHAASIDVEIHGKHYEFWLDTGSTFTLIAADVARELGITPFGSDTLLLATAAGRIAAVPSVVDSFSIGDMRIEAKSDERHLHVTNQRVAIVSEKDLRLLPHVSGVVPPIRVAGVLGSAFLRHADIHLDMPEGRVTFFPSGTRTRGTARTLHWVGYPVVRILSLAGTPLLFGVDLGADTSYAAASILPKFPGGTGRGPSATIGGFGSASRTTTVTLLNLTMEWAGQEIRFRNLFVDNARPAGIAMLDGILGRDLTTRFAVRIDLGAGVFAPLNP